MNTTGPMTLVLAPPNMTVPAGGPGGLVGDRVHQTPALTALYGRRRPLLVWPDDAVTRAFFSFPEIEFVPGQTAGRAGEAIRDRGIEEIAALYSPTHSIPPGRDAECGLLLEADAITAQLPGVRKHQRALDPLGSTPIWRQLLSLVPSKDAPAPLPWLRPREKAVAWAREMRSRKARDPNPNGLLVILSPFSRSPKKTVEDAWWRRFAGLLSSCSIVVPVYGSGELAKAGRLFAGTAAAVIEADLDQTMALASLPNVRVFGIDGGKLNLLAASCRDRVAAFYGAWPASAWALPHVQALPPRLTPEAAISQFDNLQRTSS
jgi:hypothetical protein